MDQTRHPAEDICEPLSLARIDSTCLRNNNGVSATTEDVAK